MLKGRSSTGETPRRKKLELEEESNRVTQLRRNLTGDLIQSALPNQSREDPEEHIRNLSTKRRQPEYHPERGNQDLGGAREETRET